MNHAGNLLQPLVDAPADKNSPRLGVERLPASDGVGQAGQVVPLLCIGIWALEVHPGHFK